MADIPVPPTWVDARERPAGGRDFLGLRTAAERIGYELMDGVTTVTPHVRYLTLRSWILHCYWRQERPDSRKSFREYARKLEAAVVYGNLLNGRESLYVIGADEARKRLEAGTEELALDRLVENPASDIYAGACLSFGLDTDVEDRVLRGPTADMGQPLAALLDERAREIELGKLLSEEGPPERATRAALAAFGEVVHLDRFGKDERERLVALLFPETEEGNDQKTRRLGSNTLLLALARLEGRPPEEDDVFRHAAEGGSQLQAALAYVLDGWALYCTRDLLVTSHEAVMRAVTRCLDDTPDQDVPAGVVVGRLLEDQSLLADPLDSLGLLTKPIESMRWPDLLQAIEDRTSDGNWTRAGVLRWRGDLDERAIWGPALGSNIGAEPVALLAVAWAFVLRRVGPGLNGSPGPLFEHLDSSWLPVRDVLSSSEDWAAARTPMADVFSELIQRTVEGHLDVAWARMQANPNSDGLFVHSDGLTWRARLPFLADHAASRLRQQVGWLTQLGLVGPHGLTASGDVVLEGALARLP